MKSAQAQAWRTVARTQACHTKGEKKRKHKPNSSGNIRIVCILKLIYERSLHIYPCRLVENSTCDKKKVLSVPICPEM